MSTLFFHLISPKGLGSYSWLFLPNSPAYPVGFPTSTAVAMAWLLVYLIKIIDISSFLVFLILPLPSISLFTSLQRNPIKTGLVKASVAFYLTQSKCQGLRILYKPCTAPQTPPHAIPTFLILFTCGSLQPHVAIPVSPLHHMCSHIRLSVLVIS